MTAPAPAPDEGGGVLAGVGDWIAGGLGDFANLRENARSGAFKYSADRDQGFWDRFGDAYYRGGAGATKGFLRVLEGMGSTEAKAIADDIERGITGVDIAGKTEWEDFKSDPSLSAFGGFVAGAGAESLPYMAMALQPYVGLPAVATSQTGNIAEQRALNDGRPGVEGGDLLTAAPAGIASAWLERLGLKGMGVIPGGGKLAETALGRVVKAGATEGLTEAAQSGIEYSGGTIGTKAGWDFGTMADQMLAGGLAGAPIGSTVRGGVEIGGALLPSNRRGTGDAVDDEMWSGSLHDYDGDGQADFTEVDQKLLPPPPWMDYAAKPDKTPLLPPPPWMDYAPRGDETRQLPPPVAYGDSLGDTGIGATGLAELGDTEALRRIEAGRPERTGVAESFMQRVRQAESGGDDTARNPRSSATGRYQFTDSTWLAYYKRRFGADGLTDAQILAKRGNGSMQDQLMRDLTRDNETGLRAIGAPITEGNLYLAHFAGRAGASKLLKADPAAPVETVLGKSVVKANPFLKGMTAGDAIAWAARKMGETAPAGTAAPLGSAPAGETGITPLPMPEEGPQPDLNAPPIDREGTVQREDWRVARQQAEQERQAQAALPAEREPIASAPAPRLGRASQVVTPRGRVVDTQFEVRDLSEILDSAMPGYDRALQPRDRARRGTSTAQITTIARNLDPQRLADSRSATTGAPIIGPDGQVESGNGRIAALRQMYDEGSPKAEAYKAMIAEQGLDALGVERPVLVRRRTTELQPQDRARWVSEANEADTMALSSPEQAASDARALPGSTLSLYRGGPITAAGNRDFVRDFVQRVVGEGDRNAMIAADGSLSVDGARRIRMALLARAYGDSDLIAKISEDADTNIAGIGNALLDPAPTMAQLRARIEAGEVDSAYDIGADIATAARMVSRSRDTGQSLSGMIAQTDAFASAPTPETVGVLRLFFRDRELRRPRSAQKIADALSYYATEAQRAGETRGPDMFGDAPVPKSAAAILDEARARLDGNEAEQADLLSQMPEPAPTPAPAPVPAPEPAAAGKARVVESKDGKSIAVVDASPELLAKIAKAVPRAKASRRADGAMVYSAAHIVPIRDVVQLEEARQAADARKDKRRPLDGPAPTNLDEALATLDAMRRGPAIDDYDPSRNHASHVLSTLEQKGLKEAARLAGMTLDQDGLRLNANEQRAFEIVRDAGATAAEPATPPEATPSPAPTPAPTATAGGKIEDFGEKLEGARKDVWQGWRDRMTAAEEIDPATAPLSQSWPEPDYQGLIDDGADPYVVAAVRAMRDAIPVRPRRIGLRSWANNVEELRGMANNLLADPEAVERFTKKLDGPFRSALADIRGLVDLYQEFGHGRSFKGLSFGKHHYSLYRGERDVDKWIISQKAKANAYSNWPREIAVADTREEAMAKFRSLLESGELDAKRKERGGPRFEIYAYRRAPNVWHIGVKIGREYADLKSFASSKEAQAYKGSEEGYAELQRLFAEFKDVPEHRKESNSPRIGINHRNGADVTPEQFAETFGFRGVQFGNYVEGPKRQQDLNEAYDGLLDLAGILNIPARALSLNGELGLAFGARGRGGKSAASAHYEPGQVVINLTKRAGAGSLAHEWWHSLDNYFSRQRGDRGAGAEFVTRTTGRPAGNMRPEVAEAFQHLMKAISQTALKERSRRLDKRRTKDYWATDIEMSARAFESYVIAKLEDQQGSNDYLVNIVPESAYGRETEYPYLTAAEIPVVRAGFDNFFQTVETEETETGTRLYSIPDAEMGGDRVAERTALLERMLPDEKVYGVSSPVGGARVGSLHSVRRETARQLARLGQFDKYFDDLLSWNGGPAEFGDVRIEQGKPAELDDAGMRRYFVPDEGEMDLPDPVDIEALQADLEARLKRMGLSDKVSLSIVEGLGATGSQGRFLPYQKIIQVALDATNDHTFVVDHEGVHALRELGAFSDADWKALVEATGKIAGLRQSIKRRYSEFDAEAQAEEAVADMFAMYQAGKIKAPAGIAGLLDRIRKLFTAFRNAFMGNGFTARDWRTMLDEIGSGKAAGRIGRSRMRSTGPERFSVPDDKEPNWQRYVQAQNLSDRAEALAKREGITPLQARYRLQALERGRRENPRLFQRSGFKGVKESRPDIGETIAAAVPDGGLADASTLKGLFGNPIDWLMSGGGPRGTGFGDFVFGSAQGRINALADHYDSDGLRALSEIFGRRGGEFTGKAVGRTFDEEGKIEGHGRAEKAYEILLPFQKKTAGIFPQWDRAALDRISSLLRFPDRQVSAKPAEVKAASELRKMLKEFIDYRKAAGEDIGEVTDGYLMRWFDVDKVIANKADFIRKAAQLYEQNDHPNPRRAAEGWFNRVFHEYAGLDGGLGEYNVPGAPGAKSTKARKFGKEADEMLSEFYDTDLANTLPSYFISGAVRAAKARRFGAKGAVGSDERKAWEAEHRDKTQKDVLWDQIVDDVVAKGGDGTAAAELANTFYRVGVGEIEHLGKTARRWVSNLHTLNILGTLDHAQTSSISELFAGFIHAGPKLGLKQAARGIRYFAQELRNADPSDAARWARGLGVAQHALVNQPLIQRSGAEEMTRRNTKIVSAFFKATLLHDYTNGTRDAAMQTGMELIDILAGDLASPRSRVASKARRWLADLGVTDPDGLKARLEQGPISLEEAMAGDTKAAQDYATALVRYAQDNVIAPTRTERPTWSSHPVGSLFFSLMSFSYGFKKRVLDRVWRQTKHAVREQDASFLLPALGLAVLAFVAGIVDRYVRPAIWGSNYDFEKEDMGTAAMRVADRAGITGAASPLINAITGVRYQKDPATVFAGPAIARPAEAVGRVAGLAINNSPNTNTAERNAAKAIYDTFLEPAMDAVALTKIKSAPARAAGVLATGNSEGGIAPSDREWFVSTIAGPKAEDDSGKLKIEGFGKKKPMELEL